MINPSSHLVNFNPTIFSFESKESGKEQIVPSIIAVEIFKFFSFKEVLKIQTVSKGWQVTLLSMPGIQSILVRMQDLTHSIPRYLLIAPNRMDSARTPSCRNIPNDDDFEKPPQEKLNPLFLLFNKNEDDLTEEEEEEDLLAGTLFQAKHKKIFSSYQEFSLTYTSNQTTNQLEICAKTPPMNIVKKENFPASSWHISTYEKDQPSFTVKAIFEEIFPQVSHRIFKNFAPDHMQKLLRLYKIGLIHSPSEVRHSQIVSQALAYVNERHQRMSDQEDFMALCDLFCKKNLY